MNGKKNMRRISVLVTAQTAYNLEKLAAMCGYREQGPCNRQAGERKNAATERRKAT